MFSKSDLLYHERIFEVFDKKVGSGYQRGNRPLPKYKETNPKIFRAQKDGGGRGITRGHTRPQIQKSSEPINACQIDHKSSTCLSC